MSEMTFREDATRVSYPPHIHSGESVPKIMWTVAAALMPLCAYSAYVLGVNVLILIAISVITAVLTEALLQLILKRPVTAYDGSAAVTGLLLAIILPPDAPLWMAAGGSVFAIVAVKQSSGGLGHNIFNPALAARALLVMIWPEVISTTWQNIDGPGMGPSTLVAAIAGPGYDMVASAASRLTLFGTGEGIVGASSAALVVAGGLILFFRKILTWHIPLSYLSAAAAFDAVYCLATGMPDFMPLVLFHCMSGLLLIGVFFLATDPVTSPVSARGMVLYGMGCGIITSLIRLLTGYTDGPLWAILIMNAGVPYIDRFIKPRVFGTGRRAKV